MIDDPLVHETLRQWGLKDPENACQALAETHLGAVNEVFGQWQQRDPEAAGAWLERANFPNDDGELEKSLKRSFLTQKATDDFSTARAAWKKLDPEPQKQMLQE